MMFASCATLISTVSDKIQIVDRFVFTLKLYSQDLLLNTNREGCIYSLNETVDVRKIRLSSSFLSLSSSLSLFVLVATCSLISCRRWGRWERGLGGTPPPPGREN